MIKLVPIIVDTYPGNGSSNVDLKELIILTFAGGIRNDTVTEENIKLENMNRGTSVPIDIEHNGDVIKITPEDEALDDNFLIGLTPYRLSISNLASTDGEKMLSTYEFTFSTMPDDIANVPTDETESDTSFVTGEYPKSGSSGVTPSSIKVRFNQSISLEDVSILVTPSIIEGIEDIDFVDIVEEEGTLSIEGEDSNILVFTPASPLSDNEKYTVIIKPTSNLLQYPHIYSFYSAFSPSYTTIAEISYRYPSVMEALRGTNATDIMEIIKENSEMAHWIAEEAGNSNIVWVPPQRAVTEYVKTKTRHDILLDQYLKMAGSSTSKALGDFEVRNSTSISDILDLIERLKADYLKWEALLKGSASGGKAQPKGFIRGEDADELPEYKDRSLKDWDGNKSW